MLGKQCDDPVCARCKGTGRIFSEDTPEILSEKEFLKSQNEKMKSMLLRLSEMRVITPDISSKELAELRKIFDDFNNIMKGPLPCPFCGEESVETLFFAEDLSARICCQSCGVRGPKKENKKEAIEAWNSRVEKKHETET